jgi:hypothetical protein
MEIEVQREVEALQEKVTRQSSEVTAIQTLVEKAMQSEDAPAHYLTG